MSGEEQTSQSIEEMLKLVNARSHPLKVKLLQLLQIYGELSTTALVEKTKKSKPTVLKHLEELEELKEVSHRLVKSPGAYDKRVYSSRSGSWTIRGQELRERVRKEPELAIGYTNYQLSQLLLLKDTVDSMVEYQERLNQEVKKAVENNDGDEIIELMMDHLGQNSSQYLSRSKLLERYLQEAGNDKERAHFEKLLTEHQLKVGESEPYGYLRYNITLPIRRIIEQLAVDEWTKDGNLWI